MKEDKTVTLGGFKFKQSAKKKTPRENKDGVIQVARRPYKAHRDRIREVLQAWRYGASEKNWGMKAKRKIQVMTVSTLGEPKKTTFNYGGFKYQNDKSTKANKGTAS